MSNIECRIYSCYKRTYTPIYKDVMKKLYGDSFDISSIKLKIINIENEASNIYKQRQIKSYATRSIQVYEDNILKHIVGMSNTNYDEDKEFEFVHYKERTKKTESKYGSPEYHANTYLFQGINRILNLYFANKSTADLSFYLLDTEQSYPHNKFNVLSYRCLETIGFKVLNLDEINFSEYESDCKTKLSVNNIKFNSFNKMVRDMAYISNKNQGNDPSFLTCIEQMKETDDGYSYYVDKYIYTFKSLSAQQYDSLIKMWCLKKLAEKENTDIEFRLGRQYFAFNESERKIADKLTSPVELAFINAGISLKFVTNDEFMKEEIQADEVYVRYRQANKLRNQTLFRNNIRRKGIPTECAVCGEDNTDILDAAHLWEVNRINNASLKQINDFIKINNLIDLVDKNSKYKNELFFKKYSLVNSGDNGIWLCKNHHGLFDNNYYCFDSENGKILLHFQNSIDALDFQKTIKEDCTLDKSILTDATRAFLRERQLVINF